MIFKGHYNTNFDYYEQRITLRKTFPVFFFFHPSLKEIITTTLEMNLLHCNRVSFNNARKKKIRSLFATHGDLTLENSH